MTHLFVAIAGVNLVGLVWLLYLSRKDIQFMERARRLHFTSERTLDTPPRRPLAQVVKGIFALTIILTLGLQPAHALACSGFVDCLFGFSDRTEIRNERMIEVERIQAQAQAEQARIEGEQAAALHQVDIEIERIRQQQWASEAQRDIAIAQAEQQAEQYKAMIAGLTNEKLAGIAANADTQIVALQSQAQIAIEGITQTGKTERFRIVGGWTSVIVSIILAALAGLYWMKRNAGGVMVLPQNRAPIGERKQLPWYSDDVQIVEVKHASNITCKR